MRAPRRFREDAGSLSMVLLLALVALAVTGILVSITMSRTVSARHVAERPHLRDAAQAGFDVAVAHIRAAVDSTGDGLRAALPCGPFAGPVGSGGASADRMTYNVTIEYKSIGNTLLTCTPGSGPEKVPAFADLVSTGRDPSNGHSRTLSARYKVRTSNQNIRGGSIPTTELIGGQPVCLDAGSAAPASGTAVMLRPCVSGSKQQTFAYTRNLYLSLVSSATDAMPAGMCIDGGAVPHVARVVATMQPCSAAVSPRQQWSINDVNEYEGTSDGVTLDGWCLSPQTRGVLITPVVVENSCDYAYNPAISVGAGAADASTRQLVNYAQFGRCFDVADYKWDAAYFWVWPCKQAPSPVGVNWNQKWTLPSIPAGSTSASGYIVNNPETITYPACLKSALTAGVTSYVTLVKCPAGAATGNLKWTVYGNTGVYATSYTIVDGAGYCLAAADPKIPGAVVSKWGHDVSVAITTTCDGSTLQKWNADPNVLKASPLIQVAER